MDSDRIKFPCLLSRASRVIIANSPLNESLVTTAWLAPGNLPLNDDKHLCSGSFDDKSADQYGTDLTEPDERDDQLKDADVT
ncbi:uncharacterized protein N7500_006012 [Penicillium coprophilum]|uniref:uncharacterized protein n=1 Tax=Penicillium coprophilum TaxID=36646 RepID=UPI00238CA47A|nr:uncharacterized protein N7500_006012 [Penicillium coprophilum]KAJ5164182.1 hypothetical protein N7500_006012 [Penicillium coprophilum]